MPGFDPVVIDPPNSRQGDKPRAAFNKVNVMLAELFARMAGTEANLGAKLLEELGDVQITNPEAAQFLRFDGTRWINAAVSFVTALASLSDVELGSPGDYQVLGFLNGRWTNLNAPGLANPGASILDELDDVVIANPVSGQVLRYTGTAWVNDQMIVSVDQSATLNTSQFADALDLDSLVNNRAIVNAQVKFTGIASGQARLVDKATGAILQTADINAGGFTTLAYHALFAAKAQTTGNLTTRFTATLLNAS